MKDWQNAQGRLFVRLDYADVAAWREWLPLPAQIATGNGRAAPLVPVRAAGGARDRRRRRARRREGEARATTCPSSSSRTCRDASARGSPARSARSSRARWRSRRRAASGSTRPTSRSPCATARAIARPRRQIEFDQLQLAPLVALAAHLPLPDRIRADLARFAPRGTLTHGRLRWEGAGRRADGLSRRRRSSRNWGSPRRTPFPGRPGSPAGSRPRTTAASSGSPAANATLDLPRVLAGARRVRHAAERREVGAPRRQRRRCGSSSSSSPTPTSAGDATGTYRTLRERARRNRHRRAARRAATPGRSTATCRGRSTPPRATGCATALVERHARPTRASSSPATSPSFRSPNGKGGKLVAHHEGEGRDARLRGRLAADRRHRRRRADRRHAPARSTRRAGACTASRSAGRASRSPTSPPTHPLLRIDGEAAGPIAGFLRYVNESPGRGADRADHERRRGDRATGGWR